MIVQIRPEIKHLAIDITSVKPHPRNVRQGDIGSICTSLEQHGQYRPIVVQQSTNNIIAGNHTFKAANALKWEHIAATFVDCDDETALRIMLVDNRANDNATYDDNQLSELLIELANSDTGLTGTGFDGDDLDQILSDLEPTIIPPAEPIVEQETLLDRVPAKTVPGDIWILGNHRIMCGDCRTPTDVDKLLDGATINIAFTSPPYAIQRTYDETSGFKPIPPNEYVEWFRPVADNVKQHLSNDGSWFINIKPAGRELDTELYVLDLVAAHARDWGWHFATELCWERSGVPQQAILRFKNGFEPIYQFTLDRWKFRPDNVAHESDDAIIPLGAGSGTSTSSLRQGRQSAIKPEQIARKRKHGTTTAMNAEQGKPAEPGEALGTGMAYPSNRLPTFSGSHTATGHAAAFPVGLPAWFIRAYTDTNDVVFDPFCGSGSTILAAHQENRTAFGMELSARYVDLICARFEQATGIKPINATTHQTHSFLP